MVRKSTRSIEVYSKYGLIAFYIYVVWSKAILRLTKKSEMKHGWYHDFSNNMAPKTIINRKVENLDSKIYRNEQDKALLAEDIYPLA